MKKLSRMTALMLALMLFITSLPITALAETTLDTSVWQGWVNSVEDAFTQAAGQTETVTETITLSSTVDTLVREENGPVTLGAADITAELPIAGKLLLQAEAASAYQWQVQVGENQWANIVGDTSATLTLTYAKVHNVLSGSTVVIRCKLNNTEEYTGMARVAVNSNVTTTTTEQTSNINVTREVPMTSRRMFTAADAGISMLDDASTTYTFFIHYQFGGDSNKEGTEASPTIMVTAIAGQDFNQTYPSPPIEGYTPDEESVTIAFGANEKPEQFTYNVKYNPAKNYYTVEHKFQAVDDETKYEDDENHPAETLEGMTEAKVSVTPKEVDGFRAQMFETPEIAANGETKVTIKYDREYYLMLFDLGENGYGTEPLYVRYGTKIGEVIEPTRAGYKFAGWSETKGGTTAVTLPTTMPAESKTYYAIWEPDDTAKVTVVFWGENADDEGDSYLADNTKVINLKPGKEFTYSEGEMMVCDKEVHTHTDACLGCGKTEHTHSAVGGSCYTLTCTIQNHTHSKNCYAGVGDESWSGSTGKPNNPSEGQVYSGRFGTYIYIKGTWYDYTGSTASGSIAPTTCGKEAVSHTHTDSCYTLTCTKEEHTHGAECYTCGKEAHTHNSDCYMQGAGLDSKLWEFYKSDTVTVAADGSTVVNVYYKRKLFTLHFRKAYSNSDDYGTIQEKWGADIRSKFEAKNTQAGTALWSTLSDGSGPWTGFLDKMPEENRTYYANSSSGSTHTAVYYGEPLSGTELVTLYTSKIVYSGSLEVTKEDKVAIEGFTYVDTLRFNNRTYNSTANKSKFNGATFYYTRNTFKIEYNNYQGAAETKAAKFGASIDNDTFDWKPTDEQAPTMYEPGSMTFAGWYLNPQTTGEPYNFKNKTMPSGPNNKDGEVALVLYAKWVPVTHTVEFYLDKEAYDAGTTLYPGAKVDHAKKVAPAPEDPSKGEYYTFVGWFYEEDGVEKAFDFASMDVRKDLKVYGKWRSDKLVPYTVKFVEKDDHSKDVAASISGEGLLGSSKTYEAKYNTALYEAYQEGWFPTEVSQALKLVMPTDENPEPNVLIFEYVKCTVPYTVYYVDENGKELRDPKVVSDNQHAYVTETYEPITGYVPDAPQKSLSLYVEIKDGEPVIPEEPFKITFIYTQDNTKAPYTVNHYLRKLDGSEAVLAESTSGIGYTAASDQETTMLKPEPNTYADYEYRSADTTYKVGSGEAQSYDAYCDTVEGKANDGKLELTPDGLTINLYYYEKQVSIEYRMVDMEGAVVEEAVADFGKIDKQQEQVALLTGVAEGSTATPEDGFEFLGWYKDAACTQPVDASWVTGNKITPKTINGKNVAATYYAKFEEQEVTINYVAVGPEDATNFGSVNPESETVKVKSGEAKGSTATANEPTYKFVGWYENADCQGEPLTTDAFYKPTKAETEKWTERTYYAKFEYDVSTLKIVKEGMQDGESAIFKVTVGDTVYTVVLNNEHKSVTLAGLKVGADYSITEDSNWSNRYTVAKPDNASGTIVPSTEKPLTVTFTNTKANDKWLYDESSAHNVFTGANGD